MGEIEKRENEKNRDHGCHVHLYTLYCGHCISYQCKVINYTIYSESLIYKRVYSISAKSFEIIKEKGRTVLFCMKGRERMMCG